MALPVETRGGILVHYNFPADGDYILRPKLWRNIVRQVRGLELPTQFEISIDGARVHLTQFGGVEDEAFSFNAHVVAGLAFEKRMEIRLPIKAGPRIPLGFAFPSEEFRSARSVHAASGTREGRSGNQYRNSRTFGGGHCRAV